MTTATMIKLEGNAPNDLRRAFLVLICIFYPIAEAMVTSKQPQQPLRPYLTSTMKSATSNTLVSICTLPTAAILIAS